MKKVLSLVLALTMILSCFTVALAAPEDVTDKNQIKAVDALMSLGIVNGYTDGSYKPGNTVTRAEMAKMLVEALGSGDLAQGSESSFKDAKGTWYDGYVAMAAGLELVTGYPDGTFKGDNPVSYQEAVVMTMRALGYNNSTVNNGVNSYNASKYKALGASLGLLKNVTFKNAGANRGDIALMIYNALECETVKVNEKGLAVKIVEYSYEESVTVDGKTRTKVIDVNQILLDRIADRQDFVVSPANLDKTNKLYKGDLVDLTPYMYQNITVYLNDDDEVIFVNRVNSTTVVGTMGQLGTANAKYKADTIWVDKADGTTEAVDYKVGRKINIYYNGEEVTNQTFADLTSFDGNAVTLVLDDKDEIVAAIGKMGVVGIRVEKTYKTGATALGKILLPLTAGKVDLNKVTVTGDVTSIEDIAIDDVVMSYAAAGVKGIPNKTELVVTREKFDGIVESTNEQKWSAVINGENYYTAGAFGYANGISSLEAGSEGTFYLEENGTIFDFVGKSANTVNYSLLTGLNAGIVVKDISGKDVLSKNANLSLLTNEGKSSTFTINRNAKVSIDYRIGTDVSKADIFADKDFNKFNSDVKTIADLLIYDSAKTLDENNANVGKFVITGYGLNDSNEIDTLKIKELTTYNKVNPSSKVFLTSEDVAVFQRAYTAGAFSNKLASVNDLPKTDKTYYVDYNKDSEIAIIIAYDVLSGGQNYAVLTSVSVVKDGSSVLKKLVGYQNGEKVEYITSSESVAQDVTIKLQGGGADSQAELFDLPLLNGKVNKGIAASDKITPNLTTTCSAIDAAISVARNNTTFTILDGFDNEGTYAMDKEAIYYVYTRSASNNAPVFSRIGDISDLETVNTTIKFYDADGDGAFDIVIIAENKR